MSKEYVQKMKNHRITICSERLSVSVQLTPVDISNIEDERVWEMMCTISREMRSYTRDRSSQRKHFGQMMKTM